MSVRLLPPALAEKAQTELNENPELLEESIRHIKQWILEQPHLTARTGNCIFKNMYIFLRFSKLFVKVCHLSSLDHHC